MALLIRPGLDLTAAVYACWRVGASIVVADAGLGLRRMVDALRSADPDHLIAIPAGLAAAAAFRLPGQRLVAGQLPEQLRKLLKADHSLTELTENHLRGRPAVADDGQLLTSMSEDDAEAAVLFTSGATGPPKGVVYRHRQLRAQLELVRSVCDVRPGDRLVAAFAPFALYGPALGIGSAVPAMDVTKPGTLTAAALAEAAAAIEATLVFASPAALRNVAATAAELSRRPACRARQSSPRLVGRRSGTAASASRGAGAAAGGRAAYPVRDDRGDAGHGHLARRNRGDGPRQWRVRRPVPPRCEGQDKSARRPRGEQPGTSPIQPSW